jgi:hypothetical protein
MKQAFFWIVVLIGMYLVVANGKSVNDILATLSDTSLKGIVALQGRNVKGVTS